MAYEITLALLGTGIILVAKEIILPKIKSIKFNMNSNKDQSNSKEVKTSKEKELIKKIAEGLKIEKETVEIDGKIIKQGDRISFTSDKYGRVSGEFLGLKSSEADKYATLFCLIIKQENKVFQLPLDYLKNGSLMIYGKTNF